MGLCPTALSSLNLFNWFILPAHAVVGQDTSYKKFLEHCHKVVGNLGTAYRMDGKDCYLISQENVYKIAEAYAPYGDLVESIIVGLHRQLRWVKPEPIMFTVEEIAEEAYLAACESESLESYARKIEEVVLPQKKIRKGNLSMSELTLQDAELVLVQSGKLTLDDTIEGKSLMSICGYSIVQVLATTDGSREKSIASKVVTRQIKKHNLMEGVDYTSHTVVGRSRSVEYHFTLNAANHILLAAMTDKGKAARNIAITAVTAQPVLPADPMLAMLSVMTQQREAQIVIEAKVDSQQLEINTLGSDVANIKAKTDKMQDLSDQLKFGYVTIKDGYTKYCNVCSYDVFREFAQAVALPMLPFNHVPDGTVVIVKTNQVKKTDLIKLRDHITINAKQISPLYSTHPDLNHKFKLRIL